MLFIYYPCRQKELKISAQIQRTLLIIFLGSISIPSIVLAQSDLKEKTAQAYRHSGYEAQKKGDLDTALTMYIKAAELGQQSASIFNDIGVIYEQIGVDEKAEDNYLRALKSDNQYLPVYTNLAYLYQKRGQDQKAAEYFKKRIVLGNPNDPWTIQAKEELSLLSRKLPHIHRWLIQQEASEFNRQLTQQARQDFYRQVLSADNYYQEAMALEKEGKLDQALEQYNRALTLTPASPKIMEARNKLILKITQRDLKQHSDMAMKLLESGDTVSAGVEFQRALTIIPKEPISVSR